MSAKKYKKINRLVSHWPRGAVLTQRYLSQLGYGPNLMRQYRTSHWVYSIGRGAYALESDEVDWSGGVFALQKQLGLLVHPGGRTALSIQGVSHYVRWQEEQAVLFALTGTRIPSWFAEHRWSVKIDFKFTSFLPMDLAQSYNDIQHRDFSIRISSPERAILEMLYDVPRVVSFDEAGKIAEGLLTLRPLLMQTLLHQCSSIKVKRLMLFYADHYDLPWFSEIDVDKIDLGQGKRSIIKSGRLDSKYQITIPKHFGYEE